MFDNTFNPHKGFPTRDFNKSWSGAGPHVDAWRAATKIPCLHPTSHHHEWDSCDENIITKHNIYIYVDRQVDRQIDRQLTYISNLYIYICVYPDIILCIHILMAISFHDPFGCSMSFPQPSRRWIALAMVVVDAA